jgi:hypothetical protein
MPVSAGVWLRVASAGKTSGTTAHFHVTKGALSLATSAFIGYKRNEGATISTILSEAPNTWPLLAGSIFPQETLCLGNYV